jgi:Amt family ammonium transporter
LCGTIAFNPAGANGLLFGGTAFFGKELAAVALSSLWAFGFTWAMLWLINRFTAVRVSESEEAELDESLLGETAYLEAS